VLIRVTLLSLIGVTSVALAADDDFDRLVQINKASLVMLVEQRLVPEDLARTIARGIEQVDLEQRETASKRSSNYLDFEARLVEIAGPEASRLHTGRSRQDIGSTYRRMALRDALLDTFEAQLAARGALLRLAGGQVDTVMPAYTHGVQAQPTTLAHYLLAFAGSFGRDAERLREVHQRLNRSPLGAAALGTSGFAIDRPRLAVLLGFDAPVENSYDANHVASVDTKIEFVNALAASAVTVGQLMQNLHTQYHDPRPWMSLDEGQTDVSSIMPQKRNPRPLDAVRVHASTVVGSAQTVTLNAHNTMSGMFDYRPVTQVLATAAEAREMYTDYVVVLSNLVVDKARALEEVDSGYSTMTEVADTLLREAEVPFRVAHHYASELTAYGRAAGKRPKELTDEELLRIYEETIGEELPVDVAVIRRAMNPLAMVLGRRGLGGPQPEEVLRMLSARNQSLQNDRDWLDARRAQLQDSRQALEQSFAEVGE
jgi:argininosuccinate lyase